MSRKTALARRFVGPVVAAANGISGCAARQAAQEQGVALLRTAGLEGADDLGPRREVVAAAIKSSFAAGLNDLMIVTAALAFAGALCSLLLIRSRDFVRTGRTDPPGVSPATGKTGTDSASPARSA